MTIEMYLIIGFWVVIYLAYLVDKYYVYSEELKAKQKRTRSKPKGKKDNN